MRQEGAWSIYLSLRTFSFFSVSCLREADNVSRVSPLALDGAPLAFTDCRRATGELREADARAEIAERAVAPFAMEAEGGEAELFTVGGDRREAGVARAGTAVAIVGYRGRDGYSVIEERSRTALPPCS